MGRTLVGLGAVLVASVLITVLAGRFTLLHLVSWTIWNLSLFWMYLFRRDRGRSFRCGR